MVTSGEFAFTANALIVSVLVKTSEVFALNASAVVTSDEFALSSSAVATSEAFALSPNEVVTVALKI